MQTTIIRETEVAEEGGVTHRISTARTGRKCYLTSIYVLRPGGALDMVDSGCSDTRRDAMVRHDRMHAEIAAMVAFLAEP
jgi:hypothetical protein